jgi:hypothetical protein
MTVCYLEVDDEITGAIARIRAVRDGEVVIVVPPGSRIATSRINFKLLAREGNERRLNVVAVSDDPQVRALAIAAGLPAYDSLPAAERALANFRDQDRKLALRLGGDPQTTASAAAGRAAADEAEQTRVLPLPPAPSGRSGSAGRGASGDEERAQRRRRRIGLAPLAGAAVLLLLLAGVGYGAYLFLPTANITLTPAATQVAPVPFTVVADPDVAVSDVDAGVIPAQVVEIPVTVTDEFPTTGIDVRETRSTGVVRFRSENTVEEVRLLEGTIVATSDGIQFETTETASVPVADFTTSTPGTVDVPVRAVRPGPRGNVPANAIDEVTPNLEISRVSVRNPDPTDGGRRIEEAVVSQDDYDDALATLTARLDAELAAALADPGTAPRGLTVFPETADATEPQPNVSPAELVGTPAASFDLTVSGTGQVVAVNEGLVDELAEARLRGSLTEPQQIVGDTVDISRSQGAVTADTVAYEVAPSALVYAEPNTESLRNAVRGKSIPEAQSILAPYGMVDIAIWPEFVDRLPDQTARISLVVVAPSARP